LANVDALPSDRLHRGLNFAPRNLGESGSRLEIHYAPRENLETVDILEIGRAQLSIDMAAYVLSGAREEYPGPGRG
jgi:hypothetical protein